MVCVFNVIKAVNKSLPCSFMKGFGYEFSALSFNCSKTTLFDRSLGVHLVFPGSHGTSKNSLTFGAMYYPVSQR